MKKVLSIVLIFVYLLGLPMLFSTVQASTNKNVKKIVIAKKAPKKIKPIISKKKNEKVLSFSFTPFLGLVNCQMPDGKTIKAKKVDCDKVNAFWASHKPSPSNSGGGSNSNNNSNNNSNSGNTNPPVTPTPTVLSIVILPCTSTSCGGITTIRVTGSGFTANTRVELVGSGVAGSYVGGDASTTILTDFINIPAGTYNVRIYSTTGDTQDVVSPSAITI